MIFGVANLYIIDDKPKNKILITCRLQQIKYKKDKVKRKNAATQTGPSEDVGNDVRMRGSEGKGGLKICYRIHQLSLCITKGSIKLEIRTFWYLIVFESVDIIKYRYILLWSKLLDRLIYASLNQSIPPQIQDSSFTPFWYDGSY